MNERYTNSNLVPITEPEPELLPGTENDAADIEAMITGTGGFLVTSVLLQYLPADARRRELTRGDAIELEHTSRFLARGLSARIPMICQGEGCPYAELCPLHAAGYTQEFGVIGGRCAVERMHIDHLTHAYMRELEININDPIEGNRLLELIDAEILDMRASMDLSIHSHFDWQAIGIDANGEPIVQKQLSISLQLKAHAHRRKDKILESFLATRESRAKAKRTIGDDKVRSQYQEVIDMANKIRQGEEE